MPNKITTIKQPEEGVNLSSIPPRMRGGIRRYVEDGILPGGFLRAVLENNLTSAAILADRENKQNLYGYAIMLYSLPRGCWGERETVLRWHELGGINGINRKAKGKDTPWRVSE